MAFDKNQLIGTVSTNQDEIILNICKLYCPQGIELDSTYGHGQFYRHIRPPKYRFDLSPITPYIQQADCVKLPLQSESINSYMFDPPFVAHSIGSGEICKRFGYYPSMISLWNMYEKAIFEAYRILNMNGIFIVKCQDVVDSGGQYLSSFFIINNCLKAGFQPKDIFILVNLNRHISTNMITQHHARKWHCYFLVFSKQKSRVNYFS
jgi:hypothetical protein